MLEQLLTAIVGLGFGVATNVLTSAGESALKYFRETHNWDKVIVGTGDFFAQFEKDDNSFFKDLELVLSKENMSQIAKDLKAEDGYELKKRLYNSLMQLMQKYEIPYEIAESYTFRIIYAVLEQLRTIEPEKYERYFLKEWKDEQEKNFSELQKRIDKISKEIVIYNRENIEIKSSGQIDIDLRRSTDPSIGINYFIVDDEHFQDEFEERRYEEIVFVRGRSREETICCILNELWRLNDRRPVYVVKNIESWNKLRSMENEDSIYIPWFYADEIVAIEKNTNIFVLDENVPVFGKKVLELRPRTRGTLSKCLIEAGMDYDKAYALLADTNGLYSQIKKRLFRGEYLNIPSWMDKISERAKKTCLLVGSWEEIEGDKLIIESLYGNSYGDFLEEVLPYTKGEDPLLYMIKRNGTVAYYLASTENIWSYLDVFTNEQIWNSFIRVVLDVINESENLFTYDSNERLIAQFKGERLFWSETLRRGMLKTLLIKGAYKQDKDTQMALNKLVEDILSCVKTEKQWLYISKFWRELCEISPSAVLNRLEHEECESTGLFLLFQNQSNDFLFGRNAYIDILWGMEQFLVQKEYFWTAFRVLLILDSRSFEYKSNSPKDIFLKVYCPWMNFSSLNNAYEKIQSAEVAFSIDRQNTWDYLYESIYNYGRSIVGGLSLPKYREHERERSTTMEEMQKTRKGYFKLLIKHMDFSVDRWNKIIGLLDYMTVKEEREDVFEQLFYELNQMSDEEIMRIKNGIRHLIYRHRFYADSDWTMSEDKLIEYEQLLQQIKISAPEYEYVYLFINTSEYPLLHPVPYDCEGGRDDNKIATQKLIEDKLKEFQEKGYDLKVLTSLCACESYSSLGTYLSRYWNDGRWDFDVFIGLLEVQKSGTMAIDYLRGFAGKEVVPYDKVVRDLSSFGYSNEVLAKIYRVEASITRDIPLVTNATESIKKEFWKECAFVNKENYLWTLIESRKYALLDVYLDQVHQIHYNMPLSAERIFECFTDIENMPHSSGNQMTGYHLEQLLGIIQDAYINDEEKCIRISQIEIFFMNLMDWKNMKCFHHMIKQSPELYAQIVDGVFKKDHETADDQKKDQSYIRNMYTIYEKVQFCPTEDNGEVNNEKLEIWVDKYHKILKENDQESLFTMTLGRLFSFSPVGVDNHEPCEAVRNMIEKYGDENMIRDYQIAVYNRRGVYSPTAGREELRIAEAFKENALYLDPQYPKTAKIFYGLYETYNHESERERMDAENGW